MFASPDICKKNVAPLRIFIDVAINITSKWLETVLVLSEHFRKHTVCIKTLLEQKQFIGVQMRVVPQFGNVFTTSKSNEHATNIRRNPLLSVI